MSFTLCLAGVPVVFFNEVYRAQKTFLGPTDLLVSRPLKPSPGKRYRYEEEEALFYLAKIADLYRADHDNALRDEMVALVYVEHDVESTANFANQFFPSVITAAVRWELNLDCRGMVTRQALNAFLRRLRKAVPASREAAVAVKKEVTERAGVSPILLPIRNFRSDALIGGLRRAQETLLNADQKSLALREAMDALERAHPRRTFNVHGQKCFVDARGIEFRPPGTARHGFARGPGHPDKCLIGGRLRLGGPYDRAFHYDCVKSDGTLKGDFYGCHEESQELEGRPHLNIAPNDHVRGAK